MAASKAIKVGERLVTVKELTVGAVRDWLAATEKDTSGDPLHALALAECNLADLALMSDISVADLEAYTPSEMVELIATCKELNPHFFRVRAALSQVARLMKAEIEALPSTETPASS